MDIHISGELSGIRASQLQELKNLSQFKTERSELIHLKILEELRHPQALEQAETVHKVLKQLECDDKPMITLLNKVDKILTDDDLSELVQRLPHPIKLSPSRGDSLKPVWEHLSSLIPVFN